MSTNAGTTALRVRRASLANCAIFAALLLTGQHAWARAPQTTEPTQTQQVPETKPAPQPPSSPQNDLTKVSIEDLMNM